MYAALMREAGRHASGKIDMSSSLCMRREVLARVVLDTRPNTSLERA